MPAPVPLERALHWARSTYLRVHPRMPAHLDREQVECMAHLAAWEAWSGWQPDGGASPQTYVINCVRYGMLQEMRRQYISRNTHDRLARGESVPEAWLDPLSLDRLIDDEDGQTLANTLVDPSEAVEAGVLRRAEAAYVSERVTRLPEREEAVLRWVFWDGETLRECGERLGVSESRISQIKARALAMLRDDYEYELI